MNNIFFISDTHFSHNNIIKYCNRPFSSIEEMDDTLIENWNNKVKPNDIIIHLGDFLFYSNNKIKNKLNKLNGKKYLIKGNHDNRSMDNDFRNSFKYICDYSKLSKLPDINWKGTDFILFHYPIENWDGQHKGLIHLHGHVHNNMEFKSGINRFNLSVEMINYQPISIDELLNLI